jgi:carbonic anhydrase
MDARLDPVGALGLRPGDAHVVRNAGGRVTDDVIRTLLVSAWMLGSRTVLVIHHTDCAMAGLRDEDLRARVREATGVDVGERPFLGFDDLDRGVEEDVSRLRSVEGLPPGVEIAGLVHDVGTGLLREVTPLA